VGFTDSYPSGLVNTAAAGAATTCTGGTLLAANNGNSLTYSGGTIPASSSCTVTVNVTAAVAGSYLNSTGAISASSGTISAATATLTVNAAVFGGFNSCDVGTCASYTTSPIIKTKIAGSPFSLDIGAIKNGAWDTTYNKTVRVDLVDASAPSGTVDSSNCNSAWTTVIATLSPAASWSGGLFTAGPFTVANAYRAVQVKVTSTASPVKTGCSTDRFSIRPNALVVSAGALTNTDAATASPIQKAGLPFTVTATGMNAMPTPATTTNYSVAVAPTAVYGTCGGTACTATKGTVTLGAGSTSSGVVTWSSATYSEVGAFDLTLQDKDFAIVDNADGTAASCAGYWVCSNSISVGRFVPDHFAVTPGSIVHGCGAFTYFGQDGFTTPFTITAQNAANGTTANYVGNLAKLPLTTWSATAASAGAPGYGFAVSTWAPSQPAGASFAASATAPSATPANNWVAGVATVTAKHKIVRSTAEVAPTTVTVTTLPVDSDGITSAAAVTLGSAVERFGRLRLISGQGSTTAGYTMKTEAQYWDGTAWSTNTLDSCTTYVAGNAQVTGSTGTSITGVAGITSGFGSLTLAPPTSAGTATVCLDLASSADGCTATTTPASLDYLRGNWSAVTFDKDPSGTVVFGGVDSNSRGNWGFLYRREKF
jgi:hypothetical protein